MPLHKFALPFVVLLLLLPLTATGQEAVTIVDPTGDWGHCADGAEATSGQGSYDIVKVELTRDQSYLKVTMHTDRAISGTEAISGGVEAWMPGPWAPQPNFNPGWLFDNTGTHSWNASWNSVGINRGFAQVQSDGNWAQVPSSFMASRSGNQVTFEIPLSEIPQGSLLMVTITSFFIDSNNPLCDEVGLGDNYRASIPMPGDLAITDAHRYNGGTPIIVPAKVGVLANDDVSCSGPTADSHTGESAIVTMNPDGSFSYQPQGFFTGYDGFEYTVTCNGNQVQGKVALQGLPRIYWVDRSASGLNHGSYNDPFQSIDDLISASESGFGPRVGDGIRFLGGNHEGSIDLLDGQVITGSGSTSDLAGPYFPVAYYVPEAEVAPEDAATLATTEGNGFTLGAYNTIKGINIATSQGSTGIYGGDVGELTVGGVSISGTGSGINIANGIVDLEFGDITAQNVITNTMSLRHVSGNVEITGQTTLSGASSRPLIRVTESPGLVTTFNNGLNITNTSGGGIHLQDAGIVNGDGGIIETSGGTPISVSNSNLNWSIGDVRATQSITSTLSLNNNSGTFTFGKITTETDNPGATIDITGGDAVYTFESVNIRNTKGGGIYADYGGTFVIEDATVEVNEAPAIDISNANIDLNFRSIAASPVISATVNFNGVNGTFVTEELNSESETQEAGINITNSSGIFTFGETTLKNTGGDGAVITSTDGSVNISRADIEAAGAGIFLTQQPNESNGKMLDREGASSADIKLIVEGSTIVAGDGYAVEVRTSDPRELTVAIEGNTLTGSDGEIALIEETGGIITLANFPGGDAAAVTGFLQDANEGEPRVKVEGEIGAGGNITAVEPVGSEIPQAISLSQNYPNPFNPSTTIEFSLPESGFVELAVFNLFGQRVATLQEGVLASGSYSATWNTRGNGGGPVTSGMYMYRLTAGGKVETRTMTLVK
ncbi:T9SS type A sorting domain-containing protein [Bacteroidota bacterium]